MLVIRRISCINTSGICHSMYVTVWYADTDGTLSFIHTCKPDGHLHRVTYSRCRTDTTDSPDDEHMVTQNMLSIEINIYGKQLCVKLVTYKNYDFPYLLTAEDSTIKQSKAELPLSTPRRHMGGEEVQLQSFLIPPLDEGQLSTSRPDRMTSGKEPNE